MKRIHLKIFTFLFLVSTLLLSTNSIFASPKNNNSVTDTIKILTIGNSFADNACLYLNEITESVEGCHILIQKANLGGCSLERHAGLITQSEQDETNKPYKGKSLKELLESNNWNVVTIQQVSSNSFRKETFQPYADQIVNYIRKYAPQSQIYIHETWPYAPDCKRLKEYNISHKKMYKKLRKNYKTLSKRYDNAPILGSGDALYYSYKKNKNINLWTTTDRFHASHEGCYLAGCVWFSKLFNKNPEMVNYIPEGMSEETAVYLRKAALK